MGGPGGMSALVRVRGLTVTRGARPILAGVDLDVAAGEIVALTGVSGSGKTTILRVLAGLDTPDAGEVACPRAGMVFQFHYLFEHLTVIENVCLAPVHALGTGRDEARRRAMALLEQLGVGHRVDALPRELSGGEAQRVAIARALAVNPPLLLLDEPTASLDPARRRDLGDVLRALARSGRTLLLTSHDEDFVGDVATRVLVLAGGRVVEPANRDRLQ